MALILFNKKTTISDKGGQEVQNNHEELCAYLCADAFIHSPPDHDRSGVFSPKDTTSIHWTLTTGLHTPSRQNHPDRTILSNFNILVNSQKKQTKILNLSIHTMHHTKNTIK